VFEFVPHGNNSEVERNVLLVRAMSMTSSSHPAESLEDWIHEVIEDQVMVLACNEELENTEMEEVERLLLPVLAGEDEDEED